MAGWIGAAAAIGGDLLSNMGQRQTNAQMMAQQSQIEGWETQMSDTAMQRRVEDLKAAGLNPMLAISQGGASTPGISSAQLGNPEGAFGQLGNQVSSAMQAQAAQSQADSQVAQVKSNTLLNASNAREADSRAALNEQSAAESAARTKYISGAQTDSTVQSIEESKARQASLDAITALNGTQRAEVQARLDSGAPQAAVRQMAAATNQMEADAALSRLKSVFQGVSNDQFKAMAPQLLEAQRLANKGQGFQNQLNSLGVPKAEAESDFWRGNPGMSYLNAIGHVIGFK